MNILSWQNETSLTQYPLSRSLGYDTLLIDANFVQFDNFVPILKKVVFKNVNLELTIVFDKYTKEIIIPLSNFNGLPYDHKLKFGDRYVGKLVFGADANAICANLNNHELNVQIPFMSFLVKSIPSNSGLFTLNGKHGDLHFISDTVIYYEVSGQTVQFNAVATPDLTNDVYLRTVNSVAPVNNNVFLLDSEIIKISADGASTVLISLVGTGTNNLLIGQNSSIPTNPNP